MTRLIALSILVLVCVGCTSHTDPSVIALNKANLAKAGEEVGILPDGRRVVRYELEMGDRLHNHWLYVVDGSITVNRTEKHGKTSANHTDVIIDGIKYNLVPVETDPNR